MKKAERFLSLGDSHRQIFARKVISPLGSKVKEEDIEREANAISAISTAGQNKNVVNISRHS
jgi:hypothetical protein